MIYINSFYNKYTKDDLIGFSKFLSSLSPTEFTALGCVIGLIITSSLNNNEQNSVGNFLELVGQVILTAQAQEVLLQNKTPSTVK